MAMKRVITLMGLVITLLMLFPVFNVATVEAGGYGQFTAVIKDTRVWVFITNVDMNKGVFSGYAVINSKFMSYRGWVSGSIGMDGSLSFTVRGVSLVFDPIYSVNTGRFIYAYGKTYFFGVGFGYLYLRYW